LCDLAAFFTAHFTVVLLALVCFVTHNYRHCW